jgi:hypothetical protein
MSHQVPQGALLGDLMNHISSIWKMMTMTTKEKNKSKELWHIQNESCGQV